MHLRFTLLNVQGLVTKRTNKLKTEEFQNIFNSNDIVLLTETWTNNFSDIYVNNFESYVLHRNENKKGSKRCSGGIIVYIRNKYVSKDTLVFTSQDDILWIKIDKSLCFSECDSLIGLCYVIPDESSRQSMTETNIFDRLLDSLVLIENKCHGNCNFLLCGDFNSRTSNKPDFVTDDDAINISVLPDDYVSDTQLPRYSQDEGHLNSNGHLLLDFCKQTGLRIMNGRVGNDEGVGKYTFVGNRGCSVVDYVLASQNLFPLVKTFEVQDPNILSDHCIINVSFELANENENNCNSEDYESVSFQYKWNPERKAEFLHLLQHDEFTDQLTTLNSDISTCSSINEVETCVTDFVRIIDTVASPLFKKKLHVGFDSTSESFKYKTDAPWFTDLCHEKRFYFYEKLNKYRENKTNDNRVNMVKARSEYKTVLRKARYEYDKQKTLRFENAKFKNAKLYWNLLKETAGVKPANIPLTVFEQYFKAINNPVDPFYSPDEDILHFNERYENNEFEIIFEELNLCFTSDEILKAISQLKTNKSSGPDMFINEFFIHGKSVLVPTLVNLFNKIFENGHFPETWSEGYVIPLHKKGSINEAENYRGITLLSTVGKLFTRVLNNRLGEWAAMYGVLIEAQAGFRAGMSTADNIFVLHGLISHMINSGQKLYCAFVDFTKAFDYIVRENLWYKLVSLGLRGNILNILKSMYSSVKSRVKFANKLGNEFQCSLGVRQGECLSPLLFSLYLNDIEEQFINSGLDGIDTDMLKIFMLLYADDIVIFANTQEQLQNSLDLLLEYCNRWKLTINIGKTKVMVFRKGGVLPRDLAFYYNGVALEIVKEFKYLGIVFTSGGSFSEAQNTLAGQAQKAIYKLNKYLYKFTYVSPKHKLDLFDKLITPILNYSCEVWGFMQANQVERVHLSFCKKILGVKKSTQNDFVYGELGRTTYQTKRYFIIIKYWFKILSVQNNKYIKIIYELMLRDLERLPGKANWASLIRHLLMTLGFYDVWLGQGVGNYEGFMSTLKQRLTDNFVQNWHSRLEESSRAIFYRSIASFQFQPYLEHLNVTKFSQAITKLRVSSHRLEIESGRWVRPHSIPVNDRKCSVCQLLEDEYHFVIECPIYIDLRRKYIPSYYYRRPSMLKFLELVNTNNIRYLKNLGSFIYHAFKTRTEQLYLN